MHPTTNVNEKRRPPFEEIGENRYESNVLKQLFHRDAAKEKELLPSTLYRNEELTDALEELANRGFIIVTENENGQVFELSEKTMNMRP